MNDRSTKLKRMADSERKSRTDLIKSILSGAKQMVSLGTFLFGHPDLISWVPKDRRIYLAIGEADIEFTKADAIADPGRYAWKRSDLATKAAEHCLLRAVPGHHLKYVLVDPYGENPRGLLLTSNLTPSGLTSNLPLIRRFLRMSWQSNWPPLRPQIWLHWQSIPCSGQGVSGSSSRVGCSRSHLLPSSRRLRPRC